jgi:hypothetical protein
LSSINLAGAHFTRGITFAFTGAAARTLGAGEYVIIVKNLGAFRSRYGPGPVVAGEFTGSLDNSGETLRLADASDETILEFTYDDDWYPTTDGNGPSMAVEKIGLTWDAWTAKESWQSSFFTYGTPGDSETAVAVWRVKYFTSAERTNPAISGDGADPDNDGVTNFEERLSGTAPRDPQSYLAIVADAVNGRPMLRFLAAPGKTYTIQYRDLSDGQWKSLANVAAQGAERLVETADLTADASAQRCYRLTTPQLPAAP